MKLKQIRIDGYKNLINCVVNLGDFNVLVGPNNSGKSNLLEALQMLGNICFGDEKTRQGILMGFAPISGRAGSSICKLEAYKNKPMTIGVAFELLVSDIIWAADYEVTIECSYPKNEKAGFISEVLKAKDPSKTGPAKTYIKRDGKILNVDDKSYPIATDNSSLLALRSLYPDFKDLPPEVNGFVEAIKQIGSTDIFAFSPKEVRQALMPRPSPSISADLTLAVEQLKEEPASYELFKESLCDILGLESVDLLVVNAAQDKSKAESLKLRFLVLKRKGAAQALIEEYSDGTLFATAILIALLSKGFMESIICIEEPENYLHPAALEKLLRFLQDHADKWPVLVTTHSSYLLNGVNPEDINVAVVDETGATHFEKTKNTKQLRDYLKNGFMSLGDLLATNFEEVLERKKKGE